MKTQIAPEGVIKNLDQLISVWTANDTFTMGTEVTLKKLKDTRAELDGCVKKFKELNREITETTDLRDDCAALGNQLVVRTRKAVVGFFGLDSTQYSQAGGTRLSDRKRPVRKAKANTPALDKAA